MRYFKKRVFFWLRVWVWADFLWYFFYLKIIFFMPILGVFSQIWKFLNSNLSIFKTKIWDFLQKEQDWSIILWQLVSWHVFKSRVRPFSKPNFIFFLSQIETCVLNFRRKTRIFSTLVKIEMANWDVFLSRIQSCLHQISACFYAKLRFFLN